MHDQESSLLRRRLRRGAIVGAVIVFAVLGTGITLRLHAQTEVRQWTERQAIPSVTTLLPKPADDTQELVLPGTLSAYFDAPIYARVSGYLKHWYVDIGARVRTGQVLADIETPELDQQLNQGEADLETARANDQLATITAERWKNMLSSAAVSQQEADEKAGAAAARHALLAAAQANLARLKQIASFKHVVSPFDGIITARNTDVGALINAGSGSGLALFRVADEHAARIYVDVPQTDVSEIHRGLTATLSLPDKPDVQVQATVSDISEAINVASRTMQVELMADNSRQSLLPGEYVEVHFKIPTPMALLELPTTALLFREDGLQVATVDANDRVVLKSVQLARERGATVDISHGITVQDRVVDAPPDSIANGDQVQIAGATAVRRTGGVAAL